MTKRVLVWAVVLLLPMAGQAVAAFQARDFIHWTGAATDTTAVAMADSTVIIPTAPFQRGYLYLKPSRACRLLITVKALGDSFAITGAVARTDSTKAAVWPWRGPVIPAGVADTSGTIPTFKPFVDGSGDAGSGGSASLTVDFPAATAGKFATPRGLQIPLRGVDGTWYWGHHTQIVITVLMAGGTVTMTGWSHWVAW